MIDKNKTICCQVPKKYSKEYDCYYCDSCNIWSEDKCSDDDCDYCAARPDKPVIETEE